MTKEVESKINVLVNENVKAWLELSRVHLKQIPVILAKEKAATKHFAAAQDFYRNRNANFDDYVDENIYAAATSDDDDDDDNNNDDENDIFDDEDDS